MANLPALTPTTLPELLQFADVLAKSTMVPREYQRQPANIVMAILGGRELGLGPFQALLGITVINGKPSAYGDALLGLVRASPLCEDVIERIEGTGDTRTAICEARRKGAAPVIRSFSVVDAKRAGLWGKQGPWQQYPDRMQQMRARSFALRDAFADLLRGIGQVEEMADIPREPRDITPQSTAALTDALDDFAADDATPEVDPLLSGARSAALGGSASFRDWYLGLGDDDRLALRPHVKELQDTARQADHIAPPPAPDEPAQRPRRGRSRRPPPEPTDAEIEQSQEKIEATFDPEEFDAPEESEPAPPPTSVFVPFDAAEGNIQEWFSRARGRLREMERAGFEAERFVAYRKANAGALMRLNREYLSFWQQLDDMILAGERRR